MVHWMAWFRHTGRWGRYCFIRTDGKYSSRLCVWWRAAGKTFDSLQGWLGSVRHTDDYHKLDLHEEEASKRSNVNQRYSAILEEIKRVSRRDKTSVQIHHAATWKVIDWTDDRCDLVWNYKRSGKGVWLLQVRRKWEERPLVQFDHAEGLRVDMAQEWRFNSWYLVRSGRQDLSQLWSSCGRWMEFRCLQRNSDLQESKRRKRILRMHQA